MDPGTAPKLYSNCSNSPYKILYMEVAPIVKLSLQTKAASNSSHCNILAEGSPSLPIVGHTLPLPCLLSVYVRLVSAVPRSRRSTFASLSVSLVSLTLLSVCRLCCKLVRFFRLRLALQAILISSRNWGRVINKR